MEIGDTIQVIRDYPYPRIERKKGIILSKVDLLEKDGSFWYIVSIGSEIHACNGKNIRKIQ